MPRKILSLASSLYVFTWVMVLGAEQAKAVSSGSDTSDIIIAAIVVITAIIVGVASFLLSYCYIFKKVPTFKTLISSLVSYSKEISEGNKIEPHYYALAEREVLEDDVDKGLWARALVNAKGNEDVRRAEYIKLRAKQLQENQ